MKNFNHNRLRVARQFFGFTLSELGEKACTTRQFIHQMEAGIKMPNEEMIRVLSDVLGVVPDFFTLPINEVISDQCHFSKLKTTPISITKQVSARGTLFSEFISLIETKINLPKINFPHVEVHNKSDIEKAVALCRDHWQLSYDKPITNMVRVLERAGAVVTSFSSLSDRVDALSIDRGRPVIVRSSSKTAPTRMRFDLAHECGHLVMHQGKVTGDRETENQAHYFASAFLLPKHVFIREYPKSIRFNWKALYEMKKRWNVSVQAIVRRAFDLQLIGPAEYRRANIYFSKQGLKKDEGGEVHALEKAELLEISLKAINSELGISIYGLAEEFKVTSKFLEKLIDFPITLIQEPKKAKVIEIKDYLK